MYVLLKNNMRIFNSCLKLICYSTQIQKRHTVNKEKHQSGDLKLKDQFQCNDFAVNPALEMLAADFFILIFFNLWSHINYQAGAICSDDVLII